MISHSQLYNNRERYPNKIGNVLALGLGIATFFVSKPIINQTFAQLNKPDQPVSVFVYEREPNIDDMACVAEDGDFE